MDARKYSLKEQLNYRFDNLMAEGVVAKIKVLLIATLIYVGIIGLVAGLVSEAELMPIGRSLWKALMYAMGKGTLDPSDGPPVYVILMFLTILYGIFLTATLIGLINNGIRAKVDSLDRGLGKVLESGHTIILGFNETTFVLINEIIEANKNQSATTKAPTSCTARRAT